MPVINPRGGASLAQVVQAALNVAGNRGVSIVTGGHGNGVQVPEGAVAAVEAALGWTAAERVSPPTPAPTPAPTPVVPEPEREPLDAHPTVPPETPDPTHIADTPVSKTFPKAAPKKAASKTTTPRRARRGKEG